MKGARVTHPSTMDHSTSTMRRLADVAMDLSHDVEGHFDDLQDIANLLNDWALMCEGYTLETLDGVRISMPNVVFEPGK